MWDLPGRGRERDGRRGRRKASLLGSGGLLPINYQPTWGWVGKKSLFLFCSRQFHLWLDFQEMVGMVGVFTNCIISTLISFQFAFAAFSFAGMLADPLEGKSTSSPPLAAPAVHSSSASTPTSKYPDTNQGLGKMGHTEDPGWGFLQDPCKTQTTYEIPSQWRMKCWWLVLASSVSLVSAKLREAEAIWWGKLLPFNRVCMYLEFSSIKTRSKVISQIQIFGLIFVL